MNKLRERERKKWIVDEYAGIVIKSEEKSQKRRKNVKSEEIKVNYIK